MVPVTLAALLFATISQAQPPLRTGTQAVQVDVRVVDRDGRFVRTLTKADFTIMEDDRPQEVLAVYLVDGGRVTEVGAAPGSPAAPPLTLSAARQTWVFVFDTVHLNPGSLNKAREAVRQFIRERFRDGDLAGVVANGRMINNRLTTVREELETAVASVSRPGGRRSRLLDLREWPRFRDELEAIQISNGDRETIATVVRRACDDDPSACRRGLDPEVLVREKGSRLRSEMQADTARVLTTVTALASGLARVPGPKTVVFASDGFVIERMEQDLRTAVGHAARSGARFYTIDARGLNRGSTADIIDQPLADPGGNALFDMHADGLTSLAVDTGGLAIRNHNDLGRALDLIADDARTYYVVGYRPANTTLDGRYRRIEVKVAADGVRVRARRGYLALEPARMLTPSPATGARPSTPSAPAPAGSTPPPESNVPPAAPPDPAARDGAEPAKAPAEVSPPAAATPPAPPLPPPAGPRKNAAEMVLALAEGAAGVQVTGSRAAEGWAAYERGDLESAAAILQQAAASGEARPWVYYALGFAELAQGRTAASVAAWENVRAAAPAFQAVYYDLADAYTQLRDEKMALLVLRDAERRWPSEPDLFNAMGVIQLRRGAMDDAIESFENAVKVAPQDALGYFNLGRAHQIRYAASLRYVEAIGRHVGSERDRERAIANLEKYVSLGGPYVTQAREALAALAWK